MLRKFYTIDCIALVLIVIGGLNWGLVGLLRIDLVANLFGSYTTVSRIIYILVGISALYILLTGLFRTINK